MISSIARKCAAAVALAVAVSAQANSAQPTLRSGLYEEMVVAVVPSGRLVGHYHMEQGEGVTKTCAFTFAGQAKGDRAMVRVGGGRAALIGTLIARGRDVILRLPGARGLPGCGMVITPDVEQPEGMALTRTGAGAWSDLATVRGARVALAASPVGAPGRAYVVKGDVVGVQARQGGRVKIVYPSDRVIPTQGWVPATELTPLAR